MGSALVLGVSSGTVMYDVQYYYDAQYPKLRAAFERAQPDYCKMSDDDCKELTVNNGVVYPKDADGEAIEGAAAISRAAVWKDQHSAASHLASLDAEVAAHPWLTNCQSTGICIYCNEFYENTGFLNNTVSPNANYAEMLNGDGVENVFLSKTVADGGIDGITNAKTILAAHTVGAGQTPDVWTATLNNYTWNDDASRFAMGDCEDQIVKYAQNTEKCMMMLVDGTVNSAPVMGSEPPIEQQGSYLKDCHSCNVPPEFFLFSTVSPFGTEAQTHCLNFFVGHMMNECGFGNSPTGMSPVDCQDEFYASGPLTAADAMTHASYLVLKSNELKLNFCSYDDVSCKAKIRDWIEGAEEIMGIVGAIFLGFFMVIMYFTEHAVKVYYAAANGGLLDDGEAEE